MGSRPEWVKYTHKSHSYLFFSCDDDDDDGEAEKAW